MKKFAKLFGVLLLFAVLCVVGLIAVIEFFRHRSKRDVIAIVTQLSPDTAFSSAVERLGQPTQVFTNAEEIVEWVAKIGSHIEPRVATNSVLHTFIHRGPRFRYILVYTDRESQRVVHADWCSM